MKKGAKNPLDPDGRDEWTRSYFGIVNESTSAYLLRMGCTSATPEGLIKIWEYSLPGIALRVSTSTQVLFDELTSIVDTYKQAYATRPMTELDSLRLEKAQFLCEKILVIYETDPLLAANKKYTQEQRERASKPRKLTEEQINRIMQQYAQRQQDGEVYGAVKQLANTYNVSKTTIHSIVKKHKQK